MGRPDRSAYGMPSSGYAPIELDPHPRITPVRPTWENAVVAPLDTTDGIEANSTAGTGLGTALIPAGSPRGLPTLAVTGFIDIATSDQLAQAIERATTAQKVVLDLVRADFIGTAGMTVLFQRRACFAAVLVSSGSIVDRALSIAGFPTIPTTRDRQSPSDPAGAGS